jgi:uncharacterized protein (TIGR02147 family)
METRPNIFGYNDFRKYLDDFYSLRRQAEKGFTKTYICKELGLPNTRSYFRDVLNGKYVSDLKIPLFIRLLGLDKNESQYFRVLVRFNQSNDPQEKDLLLDQLISLNRTPQKVLTRNAFAYYKEWYHSVIRAILEVIEFTGNYADLAKRCIPPIKRKQAEDSIKLLLELGLIRKNSKGAYKPTDKVIATGTFAQDDIIRQFQMKCFKAACVAIVNKQKQPKRVMTKTISISREGYKRLEKRLDKFSDEIRTIVHKDGNPADSVYQITLALFPQMKEVNQ